MPLLAAMPISTRGVLRSRDVCGAVGDRRGERFVLILGLAATAVTGLLSALAHSSALLTLALFLAGAGAASTASASGRVVVGWFPPERRGLAMGIRQMAQPVGEIGRASCRERVCQYV